MTTTTPAPAQLSTEANRIRRRIQAGKADLARRYSAATR